MKLTKVREMLPSWQSSLLAIAAAILLILAFPDFEYWFLAWFALIPLLFAVDREKGSLAGSFIIGWIFGLVFFFGTTWWLTFAPITYAGFPPVLAYFLLLYVCVAVAVFPGIFAAVMAVLLRRFGITAMLAAPFVWVFTEFLRYWLTGNNWNAIGYSQAFEFFVPGLAQLGGVMFVSFFCLLMSSAIVYAMFNRSAFSWLLVAIVAPLVFGVSAVVSLNSWGHVDGYEQVANVIAIQPNVPMAGLTYEKWQALRKRHVDLAEEGISKLRSQDPRTRLETGTSFDPTPINGKPLTLIFPESPMNFMYEDDPETKAFINGFAAKNNVSVLFNSAEPNHADGKFYNSAVLVSPEGREVAQYDKIYLLPFGEAVPVPLESIVPAFVGSFSYGTEYDLLPLGEARAGVMICFESHFGQLSRQYVRDGADVIIEMTNDGYLGDTPVLRQHLANAVFRAVETNRPVLRVTNVGITAYIDERGEVRDPAPVYQEDTRVWTIAKSDGSQTFYVRYGDWFAWLCSIVTLGLLVFAWRKPQEV